MSNISQIFERANIQDIREFLLHGMEDPNISDKSYRERIDEIRDPVIAFFQEKYPDMEE